MTRVEKLIKAIEADEKPRFALQSETETQTFRTLGGPEPDKDWRYTDDAGHRHQWPEEGAPDSFRWVVTRRAWCDECREHHDMEGHYECNECGERLEPRMSWRGPQEVTRPGRTTHLLDGEPITQAQADAIVAAMRAAEDRQDYVALSGDFRPEYGWTWSDGLEVLVDTTAYAPPGRKQPEWCSFQGIAPGTASVYPVRARVPKMGPGQWAWDEVQGWRMKRTHMEALVDLHARYDDAHPEWLAKELNRHLPPCADCHHSKDSHKDGGCVVPVGSSFGEPRCGCAEWRR